MPVGFPDYYGGLTLPVTVEEGGTGQTSLVDHAVLVGAGTSGVTSLPLGTAGEALLSNGSGADPSWGNPTVDVSQITGILAVAHGGTGSSSPALVAGNGISITGSWPDQTITNTDDAYFTAGILAVAHGGTGSSSPALVAGTGISITGTWPDNTITNSSAYASLTDPLPVAHGGTGSTAPALVAGSNISITGSWPDQTIAVDSTLVLGTLGNNNSGIIRIGTANASHFSEIRCDDAASIKGITNTLLGFAQQDVAWLMVMDTSGNMALAGTLHLTTPLSVADGGTGSSSPSLVGGTGISISGTWPDQTVALTTASPFIEGNYDATGVTTAITGQTLYTPSSASTVRVSVHVRIHVTGAVTGTVTVNANWTESGNSASAQLATGSQTNAGNVYISGTVLVRADASTAVQISTSISGIGASASYDISARAELL